MTAVAALELIRLGARLGPGGADGDSGRDLAA
jgi:hypothetical protein